jgi:hypothetical protein
MSVIVFKCGEERRAEVKKTCFAILHNHYSNTVFPNSNVDYENEGKDVYADRLTELMKSELCKIDDTEDGVRFEFDSTEDAGFSIAMGVYGTGMGYSDQGLTFLKPVFDVLVKELPDVCFEAECECFDKWVSEEYHCSYDGECFECDAEWMDCGE